MVLVQCPGLHALQDGRFAITLRKPGFGSNVSMDIRKARQLYTNKPIAKYFEPNPEWNWAGGLAPGRIARVDAKVKDLETGQDEQGLFFYVK